MPKFNVQFFKPYVRNAPGVCFADVLTIIAGLNNVQRIRTGDDPAVILGIQIQGSEFLGEAARIRMDDLPSVIDVASGNRHDLDVSEHEGLGEEIYFLYDSVIDVIAIQNRAHFRPSALALLLGQLSTRAIEFEIIFNSTAWNRFDRMGL